MSELTVAAGLARGLIDVAVTRGANAQELARRAGIDMTFLEDQDNRIAFKTYVALMRTAEEMCNDPALGLHFGEMNDLAQVSVVSLLGDASETVLEAMAQMNRYGRLVIEFDGGPDRFRVAQERGGLWIVDNRQNPNDFIELTESTFARSIVGARRADVLPRVKQVHVTHPEPAYRAEYDRIFQVPITFNSDWNAMQIDESVLSARLRLQPRYVFGILAERADALLKELESSKSMRGRVESLLMPVLHTGEVSMDTIAAKLGQSRQTLFRKLKAEGTTFEKLLDDLRHKLALDYLSAKKVSVNETAYLVGFSDPAAFSRAFKALDRLEPAQDAGGVADSGEVTGASASAILPMPALRARLPDHRRGHAMSGDKTWKTPGVTVNEITSFPTSVTGVATAVPAFIGHTARAVGGFLKPKRVRSLGEYERNFGGTMPGFNLHDSMALFYLNGGGDCFVVSAGDCAAGVDAAKLSAGLAAAGAQGGITMIAIPDAVLLKPDAGPAVAGTIPTSAQFQSLVREMLAQCGTLQDRIALLDLYGADAIAGSTPATDQAGIDACVVNFQKAVGDNFLGYGAAYFPFLKVADGVAGRFRLVPPSGAIAGLIAANDATRGVWNAPANVAVLGNLDVNVKLDDAQQAPLAAPLNGKSVNVIRDLVGRGPTVWGARTLDGNSDDYRYIQVRRTIVYIEQSIKAALQPFIFAANDGQTWVTVTGMISNFLQNLWLQGGLMGATASAAFAVRCGLGSTMTDEDILNGYMVVQVTVSIIHPAEFIELTFKQKMQGA